MLFDTHAHLDFVKDLEGSLKRAQKNGVNNIISIGTNIGESKNAIEIANKYSTKNQTIYATCGIHPTDGEDDVEQFGLKGTLQQLRSISQTSKKIVAVGEAGLDYFEDTDDEQKTFQKDLFAAQVGLASELKLPLIVHCRDGWDDIFGLIKENKSNDLQGVFHSWTGDTQHMEKALEVGFYVSFSGIVTFKNAKDIQKVAIEIPMERILFETDSPFLSPEPKRGQKNESENVKIITDFVAKFRKIPADEISAQSTKNAQKLFGLL